MLYRCKNCGGNVIYAPDKGEMFCPHCNSSESQESEGVGKMECVNCGAALQMGPYNSTDKCEFCGSYIIYDERIQGAYRPEFIMPFVLDKEKIVSLLKKEFKSRIFTPDSFLSESTLEEIKGMYVPFWMYDYFSNYDYTAKATKVRVWRSGDREYTETSYFHVARNMDVNFSKVPVDASQELTDEVMDLMEPYDYAGLQDFQEKYMSGFYGEIYNEESEAYEDRVKDKMKQDAQQLMNETLAGYTTLVPEDRNLYFEKRNAHYALLPVWKYGYSYQDKNYDFHINGQNGKIIGKTPISIKKAAAYTMTVFGGALIIALEILQLVQYLK